MSKEIEYWLPPELTLETSRTPGQLADLRQRAIMSYNQNNIEVEEFTCDDCAARHVCTLVFDLYNIDGDCLAEK